MPGDSLWHIAEHFAGARDARDVAMYSRRLYARNAATIGPSPHHIHPGDVLHLPQR